MNTESIQFSIEGPIARITLDRPRTANAQSIGMLEEIDGALLAAQADAGVRVLIVDATGNSFSSGHDLKELFDGENPDLVEQRLTTEGRMAIEDEHYWGTSMRLRSFPVPTIAAVQGYCLAAGLMLVSMCDLIVASEDAQFGNPVLRMAGAGVELLVEPWEVGVRKAKEMLFTGDTIDAEEAHRTGLVNRVVARDALAAETDQLAGRIALMPPFTTRLLKRSLNKTQDAMGYQSAMEYAYMAHNLGHTTVEWDDMHDKHLREGKTFKEFLAWRDGMFASAEENSPGG